MVAGMVVATFSRGSTNADFFPKEFNTIVSIQALPVSECVLKSFYFADTTTYQDAGYVPLTAGIGMDFAFLFGYIHSQPKLIFETSVGGDGDAFTGFGGAIAFEAHLLKNSRNDPYLFCNYGYLNMSGGGYGGSGYHIDLGGGFVYPIRPSIKMAPYVAYTPVSKWIRKKQVGYILVDPIIGPEPAYEGRSCQHSGVRIGISVIMNIFGGK